MNHGVAGDAGITVWRSCVHAMDRTGGNRAMALVAQLIDVGHIQQAGVLRTVRSVATQASFRLNSGMLKHEGATVLHVALGADGILVGGGPDIVVAKRPVNVVAVAAFDQAFVHLVMEGHVERGLHVGVALIAKLRLRGLQQLVLGIARMNAVATGAAHAGLGMR